MGIGDTPHETFSAVKRLKKKAIWYCGRGYLASHKEELESICTAYLNEYASNTESVYRACGLAKTKQTAFLLNLADQYVNKKPITGSDHLFWHDFIPASAARYFQFDDATAYPDCIRKLAGLAEITEQDKRLVEHWRLTAGKLVPIGNSQAMKKLRQMVGRLAPLDEPVLVLGPSGSGKEMIARLLHEASPRADGPFVPVNRAIMPNRIVRTLRYA